MPTSGARRETMPSEEPQSAPPDRQDTDLYTLTSSAGLNTTAVTIEQVAAVFAQHLHDMAPDGPIHWKITTPRGNFLAGDVRLNGIPDDGFSTKRSRRSARTCGRRHNQPASPFNPHATFVSAPTRCAYRTDRVGAPAPGRHGAPV